MPHITKRSYHFSIYSIYANALSRLLVKDKEPFTHIKNQKEKKKYWKSKKCTFLYNSCILCIFNSALCVFLFFLLVVLCCRLPFPGGGWVCSFFHFRISWLAKVIVYLVPFFIISVITQPAHIYTNTYTLNSYTPTCFIPSFNSHIFSYTNSILLSGQYFRCSLFPYFPTLISRS